MSTTPEPDPNLSRRLPASTYRLQFHAKFTFRDATAIVPYLASLGITHCYASPYLKAVPGSTHGYDVIDHNQLNPEVGTEADYNEWLEAMNRHGMSHILDTVPNHVGVATNENVWWNDVLENGPASRYAEYFDVTWRGSPRPDLHDRVLLPLLGGLFGRVLEKGELKIELIDGAFWVSYYARRFPISPRTYPMILEAPGGQLPSELREIVETCRALPERCETGSEQVERRREQVAKIKSALAELVATRPAVGDYVRGRIAAVNGTPGEPRSFDTLDAILTHQCYRLAYWKTAPDEINYRRFFDVNDLAAIRMERRDVFAAAHKFTMRLLAEGKLAGLRIDHPDGLYDPRQYLDRLQDAYRRVSGKSPLYVVVEKILALDERLPDDWAVNGTSGYDFLDMLNGLFVRAENEPAFTRTYAELTGRMESFADVAYEKKKLILRISLASELHMLARQLADLAIKNRGSRDFTETLLRDALAETIACFPVYRTYILDGQVSPTDRRHVETAIAAAKSRNPAMPPEVFDFLRDTLLLRSPAGAAAGDKDARQRFVGKFQQLTSPVTAKGIEDTSFYLYNRLLSLNEVGGDPGQFGLSPDRLHAYLQDRQQHWPYALSPLSTHDTKRSEDVRARLNALSNEPAEWREHVTRWFALNAKHRTQIDGKPAPDPNDEYFIYQTLIGAWPVEPYSTVEFDGFVERVVAYLQKAFREAKEHTSWTDPKAAYEEAVTRFVKAIVAEPTGSEFLADFRPFQRRICAAGFVLSLAQTTIRLTAPGVPDTYQGTELWDFSLVDPDNRRPVDYALRNELLADLARRSADPDSRAALVRELAVNLSDGRFKLFLTAELLRARRQHPDLFSAGDYLPLEFTGTTGTHFFGFAREHQGRVALVVVPRVPNFDAGTATAMLPPIARRPFRNLLTGRQFDPQASATNGQLPVQSLLDGLSIGAWLSV